MTSRERIRAALQHKMPDMLPIDFAAHRSSGIAAVSYNRLKRHLGFAEETTKLYDLMQQLAMPEPCVRDRLGGDVQQVYQLKPAFGIRIDRWKPGKLTDGTPCQLPYDFNPVVNPDGSEDIVDPDLGPIARRPANGLYFDSTRYYLEGVEDVEELKEKLVLPTISEEELDFLEKQAKDLYENSDKALLMHVGCAVFEQGQQDFGYEDFYYNLAAEPEIIHYWGEKMTEARLVMLDKILERVGPYIDVALFGGDDMGTQIAPQMSTKMYREMIKPYQKAMYQFVHQKAPNVAVGLHSCGAIRPLIPDIIDAGVDVLNPIQVSATGMDPRELKREFGKDLVFWGGGSDMQGFVSAHADPKEVYNHTRGLIEILAQDGGFVFTQVHNILADIDPARILAIYQAALDFRKEQGSI